MVTSWGGGEVLVVKGLAPAVLHRGREAPRGFPRRLFCFTELLARMKFAPPPSHHADYPRWRTGVDDATLEYCQSY